MTSHTQSASFQAYVIRARRLPNPENQVQDPAPIGPWLVFCGVTLNMAVTIKRRLPPKEESICKDPSGLTFKTRRPLPSASSEAATANTFEATSRASTKGVVKAASALMVPSYERVGFRLPHVQGDATRIPATP